MIRRKLHFDILLVIGLFLLGSCSRPKITSFTALPKHVDYGVPVVLDWDGRDVSGMTVTVYRDTTVTTGSQVSVLFSLKAGTGPDAVAHGDDIEILPLGGTAKLYFEPVVKGTKARVEVEVGSTDWPDEYRLKTVAVHEIKGANGLKVTVRHNGRAADLLVGGDPSEAWKGSTVSGPWALEFDVPDDVEVPDRVILDIRTRSRDEE